LPLIEQMLALRKFDGLLPILIIQPKVVTKPRIFDHIILVVSIM
jgi:hypothetical protein